MDKKRILRYLIYFAVFALITAGLSVAVVKVKHRIIDNEISATAPGTGEYSLYFDSLTYREQLLYNAITYAAENMAEESDKVESNYTKDEFGHIISCIRADRPDLFYVDYDSLVLYKRSHQSKVELRYISSNEEVARMKDEYNAAMEKALLTVNDTMTDFEKELALTHYLTDLCEYSSIASSYLENTAYGALVLGKASCDGYAYAAKDLLNSAYIDAFVIYGKANGTEHVWNMVKIEGEYYHLDVTWNDSDNEKDEGLRFHGYFNLSDSKIGVDHSFDDPYDIIPCASDENCYYRMIGCYTESEEELEEIFFNALDEAVKTEREYIELEYIFSKENTVLKPYFMNAIGRINDKYGEEVLYEAFTVRSAGENSNAITVRLFYN